MPKGGNRSLGEDQARTIAEECYDEVLAYCKRHAPAGHEAADLAQETFLRFVRAGSYRERGKPIAYLLRVARNVCVDASRNRRLETVALDFDVADEAAAPVDEAEANLETALAKLPDDLRETIEQTQGFYDMTSEQVIEKFGLEFWQQTLGVVNQRYYMEVVGTLDSHNPRATSLDVGAQDRIEAALEAGMNGSHPYSDAAKNYWRAKAAGIAWPAEFGYAEGWGNALSWMSFLALVIVAACIAISGVFAGEYQGGTAAVVLPTKRGKRALPAAKVIAALIFVTCFWWLSVAVGIGINLAICGTGGLDLPVQIVFGFDNPYPLTIGQTAVLVYGLGWLVSLGFATFTLWFSSCLRSTMPVAVVPLAITFLGLLGLFSSLTDRIAVLTPLSVLNYSFERMVSYDIGNFVVDLPTLAAVLYALVLVVLAPFAMRAFRRHQVT